MSRRITALIGLVVLSLLGSCTVLQVHGLASSSSSSSKTKTPPPTKNQLPKYDKGRNKWIATGPNQLPDSGYGPIKTLFLQGPKPYMTRILQNDDYEQAVLKFMASDKIISRDVAQGNMDAYLRNPQDWMYNRMESTKKGFTIDYTKLEIKDIVLVSVWSITVISIIGRIAYSAIVLGTGPFAL
jgi:hypothetical protein